MFSWYGCLRESMKRKFHLILYFKVMIMVAGGNIKYTCKLVTGRIPPGLSDGINERAILLNTENNMDANLMNIKNK